MPSWRDDDDVPLSTPEHIRAALRDALRDQYQGRGLWPEGPARPGRVLPGVGYLYATCRCIFCGTFAWSVRELIDHFSRHHGRVL